MMPFGFRTRRPLLTAGLSLTALLVVFILTHRQPPQHVTRRPQGSGLSAPVSVVTSAGVQEETARGARGSGVQQAWAGTGTRLFCLILTTEKAWTTRRRAVRHTWAQRCDHYCFFYTQLTPVQRPPPDACPLHVPEGRPHLAEKTLEALAHVHAHHRGDYDWVLKADDDTYVVVENLKALLARYKPSDPHYLGYLFLHESSVPFGHHSGGAGYVLSARAVDLLRAGRPCDPRGGVEDLAVARCLQALQVYAEDTKDGAGRVTFHPEEPSDILTPHSKQAKYFTYTKGNLTMGKGPSPMLSPDTVSFHHVPPHLMYVYDFLLYDLHRHAP